MWGIRKSSMLVLVTLLVLAAGEIQSGHSQVVITSSTDGSALAESTDLDPLIFSTYLGGNDEDEGRSVAVDTTGAIYVAGSTGSSDFPCVNAFDNSTNGGWDCFVTKLASDGRTILYSTLIGGSGSDIVYSIAVDALGGACIVGSTSSHNFPVTPDALRQTKNFYEDCFLTRLSSSGDSLLYSTFIGGAQGDYARSVVIDGQGDIYVTGSTASPDFPLRLACDASANGGMDCFVMKMNGTDNTLIYSTYIGGNDEDIGSALAVDSEGNAYITGRTRSYDFPTVNSFQSTLSPPTYPDTYEIHDCFIVKLDETGASLLYSTYLGGEGADYGNAIAVDEEGCAYVAGESWSVNFPQTPPHVISSQDGHCFVTKLGISGDSLVYSWRIIGNIAGPTHSSGRSIAIEQGGIIYVAGYTLGKWPVVGVVEPPPYNVGYDVFVAKLNLTADNLIYSAEIGGAANDNGLAMAVDSLGIAYVTGLTASWNFPTTNALDNSPAGTIDGFLFKIPDIGDNDDDGLSNYQESVLGTDPESSDTDSDTMPDFWEASHGLDPLVDDTEEDMDSDGLTNYEEFLLGSEPDNEDTDSDGLDDGTEVHEYGTSPVMYDTDGDDIPDGWEIQHELSAITPDGFLDPDRDALTNRYEWEAGTDPHDNDTDNDFMPDGWEVNSCLNATRDDAGEDPDSDGLTNLDEYYLGTDPCSSDSDWDGVPDGWEISHGFDPIDGNVPISEILVLNLGSLVVGSVSVLVVVVFLCRRRLTPPEITESDVSNL